MQQLSHELGKLEIDICKSMLIEASTESNEALQKSAKARRDLAAAVDAVNGELREHLTRNNTRDAGVISWIKPGMVSTAVCPEPLNFKEVMKFLLDHEQYDSNGYDIYDFYAEDVDVQFKRIMDLLLYKEKIVYAASKPSKLSCWPYERLKARFFPDGMPDTIKYTKFVESMAPILQTSTYMLEQVMSGSVQVAPSDGKKINS